jgi:cobalamin synthase
MMPVTRAAILRTGRPNCGRRPVVVSFESGSATTMAVISRSSETALIATRASWSAVAAPAETPSTVAVVRIVVAGTFGFRPSTTATTTASVTSCGTPTSSSATTSRKWAGQAGDAGGAAQALRSAAVTVASC